MRAGKVVSGEDTTLREVKKERTNLVVIANDSSDNTKKLFMDKCSFRNIDYIVFGTKEELGKAIGKSPRAVLGIIDNNIANQIKKLFTE